MRPTGRAHFPHLRHRFTRYEFRGVSNFANHGSCTRRGGTWSPGRTYRPHRLSHCLRIVDVHLSLRAPDLAVHLAIICVLAHG